MPQNFLYPQRDQPLLLPADMREWLSEDDLVWAERRERLAAARDRLVAEDQARRDAQRAKQEAWDAAAAAGKRRRGAPPG